MRRSRLLAPLAALLLLSGPLLGMSSPARAADATTEQRLSDVEKKLDAALAEIERMKLGAAAPETTAQLSRHGMGPGASRVYNTRSGPSLGGYGEILLSSPDGEQQNGLPSGQRPSADVLRAVFYVGHRFTSQLLFNSEVEWEHSGVVDEAEASVDPFTGQGEATLSGEASVEFAYLDWQSRKELGIRAGKVLVPVGLINELHEPPVFLSARRPDVEQFVIPTTWSGIGAGLYGETDAGLEWRAYLMEGLDATGFEAFQPIREGRQGGSEAVFTHPAITGRVDWKGTAGLMVGVSGFTGDSWQEARPVGVPLSARVTMGDVHATFGWRGFQARGLWTAGTLGDAGALSDVLGLVGAQRLGERFSGGYIEAAYDVAPLAWPGTQWRIAPYLRMEQLDSQDSVPGGSEDPALDRDIFTFGLGLLPHPNVVVKADRELRRNSTDTETGRWNLSLGWMF